MEITVESREERLTGTRSPTRSGSKTWSARSLMGRESSVERKDLVKASSDMVGKAIAQRRKYWRTKKPLPLELDVSIVGCLFVALHTEWM